jgi:hypothetical protein
MNLMNLIRLCGLVVIGWTLMALGVGMFGTDRRSVEETNFFLPEPALHEAVAVSRSRLKGMEEYRLVNQSTGRAEPLPLPDDANWGLVSVSPWRDQAGNLEAVGRWSRPGATGEKAFCGLGLFSLTDTTVVHSIDLDVLPTGKPCWVPGRPGDLLFPAGDGQLHRCHLRRDRDGQAKTSDQGGARASSIRPSAAQPVTWRCAVPGSGTVFISDPVWPGDPQLRRFVFAALSRQTFIEGKLRNESPQIWWLEMSEGGDEIRSAGRLTAPGSGSAESRSLIERMPSVSVGPPGRLTLAYLTRGRQETSWRLCLAALSFKKESGKPVVVEVSAPKQEVTDGLLPMPPTFSADGQSVFASAQDGRIKKYSLAR